MLGAPEESDLGDGVLTMYLYNAEVTQWVKKLSQLESERARRDLVAKHTRRDPSGAIDRLYQEAVELARVDLRRAERVVRAAEYLASELRNP